MSTVLHRTYLVGLALVAATLTGCGAHTDQPVAGPSTVDTSQAVTSADDSGSSASSPEAPPPDNGGGGSGRSVHLASLPVGGGFDGDDQTCVGVNWRDPQIPDGVRVKLTGGSFDPPIVQRADSGCGGDAPPCPGFVFSATDQACELAVRVVSPPTGSDAVDTVLQIGGTVLCDHPGSADCTSFAADAKSQSETITLTIQPVGPDQSGSDQSPSGGSPSSDASPGDGGTSAASTGTDDSSSDG